MDVMPTFTPPHFLSEKNQEKTGAAHEPPLSAWRVCAPADGYRRTFLLYNPEALRGRRVIY